MLVSIKGSCSFTYVIEIMGKPCLVCRLNLYKDQYETVFKASDQMSWTIDTLFKIHYVEKWLYVPAHLPEARHDLNNQTISFIDVFMAEQSKHKTEDLRRAC